LRCVEKVRRVLICVGYWWTTLYIYICNVGQRRGADIFSYRPWSGFLSNQSRL